MFMHSFTDYLVVGSDSGRIVILEYNAQKNIFEKVCILSLLYLFSLFFGNNAKVV